MLDNQHELDEALSRTITNDTTDTNELEDELEELLKQPTSNECRPLDKHIDSKPIVNEVITTPEQDPFVDLELRLQKLVVQERRLKFD
jgi:hypothetical protein